jgi:two-component system, OmpR family, sensor histidine kinase ChvG
MISIISKPFMALGIAIRNSAVGRFFFAFLAKLKAPFVFLLRRGKMRADSQISGLSIRILAVNIIAIMILGLGILYLGQYTDSLIDGELTRLRSEAQLFSGAIAEGAVRPVFQVSPLPFDRPQQIEAIKPDLARRMVRRLGEIGDARIRLYAIDGTLLTDSHKLAGSAGVGDVERDNLLPIARPITFDSLFSQSAARFLDLIPMKMQLPLFPQNDVGSIFTFTDTQRALSGTVQASAWRDQNGRIVLTVAAPVQKVRQVVGVVLLIQDGNDLEKAIAEVRVDVFRVFLGSLGITVMLSIYLSGLITKPLQRLAIAAEAVRQGKGRHIEIPDMSHRNDEIGELSMALRDMTHALFNRMDTIERFAADVAHEIKNPLTSLRSAVETVTRVKDEDGRSKLMNIIHHDVRRLDRLISDISNASRLDAELSRDELGTVDISGLLLRLRDAYKKPLKRDLNINDAEETGIRVELSENQVLMAKGNADRLSQVFGNILGNALSFSPMHGTVVMRAMLQGDKVIVQVDDEGPGIPENKLETIFERFYSERPQHESYGNHSGLGLSISKQIIESHGGQIWAENRKSDDGRILGARFVIVLAKG